MDKLGKLFLKMLFFVFVVAILGGGIYAFASGLVTFGPPPEPEEPCTHEKYTIINDEDPTCIDLGYSGDKKCDECGEVFEKGEPTPPTGHIAREIPAVEATCTKNGNTAGSICAICSTYIVTPTSIEKKAHNVVDTPTIPATCTQAGSVGGKHCTVCSTVIEEPDEVIPAIGHEYLVIPGYAATCVEKGLSDATVCTVCDKTLIPHKDIPIDASNHVNVIAIEDVAATCTENGYKDGKICDACTVVVVEPTVIDAFGHDEVAIDAVAPTCMQTGLTEGSRCSVCEIILIEQQIVEIDPNAHHHVKTIDAVEATCTENGCTEGYVCDNADADGNLCGDEITSQVIPAHGHEIADEAWEIVIEATETTAGEKKGQCPICGETVIVDIPATGENAGDDLGNIPDGGDGNEGLV